MKTDFKIVSIVILLILVALNGCVGNEQPNPMDPGSQETETDRPPYTPYDLRIVSFGDTIYNLSWKDSTAGETGYEIFRRKASEAYANSPLMYAEPGTFNINDESVVQGIIYYYKIRAYNLYGKSSFSFEINTGGTGGSSSVAAPGGLQARSSNPRVVKLTWVDNSSNENYFGIERKSTYSDYYTNIALVPRNSSAFTDSGNGLIPGGEYYYRIKAYSGSDSSWSDEVYIQTPPYALKPPVITSVINITSTSVQINWKDNEPQFTYNYVYRRTSDDPEYKYIGEAPDYLKSYTDEDIVPSKTYFYKLLSTDATISSEFSAEISITTVVINLLPPEFNLYYYGGGNKINLSWQYNQSASRQVIERREVSANPPVITLIEIDGSRRTYVDYVNACNKTFEYRIQAADKYSTSAFSSPVTVDGGCW